MKISIITPSYNQGKYLEQTILSILNQDYEDLEYIIIDGGSSDNSVEIIKRYANRLAYWISEKDSGQTEAINKGFKKATGKVVGWINSDDILMPDALKKIRVAFERRTSPDVIFGWTLRISEDNKILFNHFLPKPYLWLAKKGVFYFGQQSWFWKREMFDYLGFLDESCHACMDIEFIMRQFIAKAKMEQVPHILAGFRQHELTKTSQNGDIWTVDRARLKKKYKILNYRTPRKYAKIVYGIIKLVNGNYFRQFYFKYKWQGEQLNAYLTYITKR